MRKQTARAHQMLPKPRRPRERCIYPLSRVTYSVPEYCDITGLTREAVLRLMDDGSLPSVKIGIRRLILSRQPPPRDRNPKRSEKSS
jgi:excisionase family DNA binding protein